jgi:DNA polymerase I-like protein with 3'-5' exonuclease and polymerase domains
MLKYCRQDVAVTVKLFTHLQSQVSQYKNIDKALRIEHQFAYIISKQIQSGFYLDQQEALDLYNTLSAEYNTLELSIKSMMPCIKENTHYKLVTEQKRLLSETDTTYTYIKGKNGKIETKPFKFIDPNPTSRQQIASFLQSKGWEPKEFTETNLPQINEKILESIKLPEAKLISRLFRVQKQMGMIKDGSAGWLKCINPVTGRVHGDVHTNATNTGRCSHSKPNMSQVDKKDLRMRNVWKAKEGWSLVGIDAASLELRMLAHYLHHYDNGAFAHEVVHGDIHTYNQETFGLENRDSAKTLIYAMIYGGGNKKLGKIFYNDKGEHITSENVLLRAGSKLKTHINETFTGYQELVTDVTQAFGSRGYLLGLDGRPLHPRKEYSALNLLLQSAGAIIMKQALINSYKELSKSFTYEEDYTFVANVHDEIQIECKPDIAITIGKLVVNAIITAGIDMGLKCELNGEYKIGKTWAQTH